MFIYRVLHLPLNAGWKHTLHTKLIHKYTQRYISTQLQQELSATYKVTIIHRHMHAHIHTGGRKQKYPGEKKGVASGKSCVWAEICLVLWALDSNGQAGCRSEGKFSYDLW